MTNILFIAGMHRSLTSAFAGAALLLQENAKGPMIGPSGSNAKGHFEPISVVSANKALIAARQRVWFDCRPMPQVSVATAEVEIAELVKVLVTEWEGDGLQVVKDPRISLFVPAWFAAARRAELKPHLVGMVRNPAASAASLCRRDKLDFNYAVSIWLRYMFDLERDTRGLARKFVDAAAFSSAPVTVLADVAATLGLTWSRQPESARDSLLAFVDPALPSPATAADCDLLPIAFEVQSLLLSRDTHQTRDRLDGLATAFNAMAPALYNEMVLRELGRCLRDRWELDATRARLAEAEQSLQQQGASQR